MLNENIVTVAEVSEMMFEAKFAYLLEGFTYAQATELWFAARN
ncbi:hypothetical protein V7128_01635 [Neobacillus vireti]